MTENASPRTATPEVVIYTRKGCGFCMMALRLLDKKAVAYIHHDATGNPEMRQEMIQRANGGYTFPQIFIGDRHVGGYTDLAAWERSGELDKALAGERTTA